MSHASLFLSQVSAHNSVHLAYIHTPTLMICVALLFLAYAGNAQHNSTQHMPEYGTRIPLPADMEELVCSLVAPCTIVQLVQCRIRHCMISTIGISVTFAVRSSSHQRKACCHKAGR
ncbi:hypothetical protein BX667DRAFT_495967 [Coemansia mojavensis]|nr:hypothetical protein BX667DRAFT_495967 [Coemansia mojavensis]